MKKVLSLVLVLALVLGSFSMAFAVTDVEGDANETAIKVVNDLGIVTGYPDGTFKPDNAVSRAEFAAMITRALAIPESALAGYSATSFNDVEGYAWAVPYLAFCNDKGIMLGDGAGNAMPGRTINVNEAMTMVLRAMGLVDSSAILVGSWPANYVTVAKNAELYDNVAAVTTVDRASAAQIIYNALTVNGYVVDADGNTGRTAPFIDNLAAASLEGVVAYTAASLVPMAEYIGSYATTYYNADGEIVAIDPASTFLTGTLDATAGTFTVDDVDYTVASGAVTTYSALNNGAATVTIAALTDGDYTLAVEVVGKTIKTVYSTVAWTVTADDQADETTQDEIADDQKLLGKAFSLDANNEIKDASYQLLGAASLDKIAEDHVVYVYTLGNGSSAKIVKIEVGTETVTGKVTKISYDSDDATTYYAIGGNNYALCTGVSPLSVGDEGTATLDYAGKIYKWDETSSLVGNYAVVVATDSATSFGDTTSMVKIFTKDGANITPVVDTDAVSFSAVEALVGSLVDYSLNADGEVKAITDAGMTTVAGVVSADHKLIGTQKVATSVIVYLDDATDGLSVGSMADLADSVTVSAIIKDGEVVAILADTAYTGSSDSTYGIITATGAEGLDADGNAVDLADIILEGVAKADVQTTATLTASTTTTALYEITVDEDGVITAATTAGINQSGSTTTVSAIDGNIITLNGGASYTVAADAVVYVYDAEDGWSVGKLSGVKKLTVKLLEVDGAANDEDGVDYVIAW